VLYDRRSGPNLVPGAHARLLLVPHRCLDLPTSPADQTCGTSPTHLPWLSGWNGHSIRRTTLHLTLTLPAASNDTAGTRCCGLCCAYWAGTPPCGWPARERRWPHSAFATTAARSTLSHCGTCGSALLPARLPIMTPLILCAYLLTLMPACRYQHGRKGGEIRGVAATPSHSKRKDQQAAAPNISSFLSAGQVLHHSHFSALLDCAFSTPRTATVPMRLRLPAASLLFLSPGRYCTIPPRRFHTSVTAATTLDMGGRGGRRRST